MKKVVVVVGIVVIGLCIFYKSNQEKEEVLFLEEEKEELSVGLPVGTDYLYQNGDQFVKVTINTPHQWAIKTETMNYPKKMTVRDLNEDRDRAKLLQFIAKESFIAGDVFSVTDRPEGSNYYLVMDGDDFYLAMDPGDSSIDIEEYAKYGDKRFVRQ